MCVRECVCVYVWVSFVVCVQFSSIWLFLNGGGRGLTCVRLCLTTIACTLKWQQAVFPLWSRSGRIQVGFNSCRFEQCPLQFRRSRNATEHLTDTRLRFESYDLLIWHSSSWKPETEHMCVCVCLCGLDVSTLPWYTDLFFGVVTSDRLEAVHTEKKKTEEVDWTCTSI